jgi:predicted transcriptional regulator
MKKKGALTPKQRLDLQARACVMTDLGRSQQSVADELGVSRRTVIRWLEKRGDAGADLESAIQRHMESDEYVSHVTESVTLNKGECDNVTFLETVDKYLAAAFVAFTKHLEYSQDETWFKGQDPDKVAIFDGVHADKVLRVLDSISGAQRSAGDGGA